MAGSVELKAPALLVAMPQVLDPFFHKSVVLLVAHEEAGSLGFVVNRPTEVPVEKILAGMELSWSGPRGAHAFFGGPVQPQLGSVLYDAAQVGALAIDLDRGAEIDAGVGITQHAADLARLAAQPPPSFRLILGYAGWNAGQLVEEVLRNDWLVAPVDRRLVFSTDADSIWTHVLRSLGVDPATLPSWTATDGEGQAN
jgi:putative transcriptional regulator